VELGVSIGEPVEQIDKYFSHPARDFAKTDEALRMRRVGAHNFLTYKGARIDSTTKTRRELELPLPEGTEWSENFESLLGLVGFEPVMTVRKTRRKAICQWEGFEVEICLDEIDQLGSFIELEITSDLEGLDQTKAALESLAKNLDLSRSEKRSYLELLMNQLGPQRVVS
jgi:adenylate cyclase class 2